MSKLKKTTISTITYAYADGFMIDIVRLPELWEVWLYHRDYGIKSLMFGLIENDIEFIDELMDIVMANIDTYIPGYREEYMD